VAAIIFFFGRDAGGSGKEVMERMLFTDDKQVAWYLPFLRIGGLVATFGFGGAGGVFAPSLSIGAAIGALVADLFNLVGGQANVLILVGMTAFLTGITRAPFTAAIIVFEMTDRHSIIFFLMLGALIAYSVAGQIDRRSLYDRLREGYVRDINSVRPENPPPSA
jgi:H+/Cl- antiporter ClcA